jgi:hypothetical protein
MWSRYLSNVELAGPYGEECWQSVFSDGALTWLFSRALLIAPFPSPSSMIQFSKRWKTMVGLRRKFADAIILNQQANYIRSTNPGNSIPLLPEIAPHSSHLSPRPRLKNYSLLPFLAPRPGLKRLFPRSEEHYGIYRPSHAGSSPSSAETSTTADWTLLP